MESTDLIRLAKRSLLSTAQISELAAALEEPASAPQYDLYTVIHALGEAGCSQYRDAVERYLVCPRDPMLSRISLDVLCRHFGFLQDYVEVLERFVGGVDWDVDGDVQQLAISLAGEFLRESERNGLLFLLIDIATDLAQPEMSREDAVLALARAHGDEWGSLPMASRHFSLESDWVLDVLERSHRRHEAASE